MVEKVTDYMHDIAYYAKDSRLTEPSAVKGMSGGKWLTGIATEHLE